MVLNAEILASSVSLFLMWKNLMEKQLRYIVVPPRIIMAHLTYNFGDHFHKNKLICKILQCTNYFWLKNVIFCMCIASVNNQDFCVVGIRKCHSGHITSNQQLRMFPVSWQIIPEISRSDREMKRIIWNFKNKASWH